MICCGDSFGALGVNKLSLGFLDLITSSEEGAGISRGAIGADRLKKVRLDLGFFAFWIGLSLGSVGAGDFSKSAAGLKGILETLRLAGVLGVVGVIAVEAIDKGLWGLADSVAATFSATSKICIRP